MSRSGYSDDCGHFSLYRHAVHRATTGYRGQRLLKQLLAALDAMPVKRLVTDTIRDDHGDVCAFGALDPTVDDYEADALATHFGIANALAAEIVYQNDEHFTGYEPTGEVDAFHRRIWRHLTETPEQRWVRMRAWVVEQIITVI